MKPENSAHRNKNKRLSRNIKYTQRYRDNMRSAGFAELRGLTVHEEDKDHVETLIDSLNSQRERSSDTDVLFRIDNNTDKSVAPAGGVHVVIDGERVKIPNSSRIIQPGNSFIFRQSDLDALYE